MIKIRPDGFIACITIVFLVLVINRSDGQTYRPEIPWQSDTLITEQPGMHLYQFPARHRPNLGTLQINRNGKLMQENLDYVIEEGRRIRFFTPLHSDDSLRIRYKRFPVNYKMKYTFLTPDTSMLTSDTTRIDSGLVALRRVKFENPFTDIQSGITTSGSIMRGVKVGTNSDFALNSGLNLELSGKLTENLEVVAALNDEATPIQPEGNTQSLKEIDKVFVKFRSPYVSGTVGDFNLLYQNSEFGNLQRKLQGLTLLGEYKGNYTGATISTTRGFFHHVSFVGQEGNQGPYQLTGKNGEQDIVVLAGTERIYINGALMVRGETNDYTIEYGNGQIIFSNRRLITSESRIEVDFEYFPAQQKYSRNVYSGVAGGKFFNDKLSIDLRLFREADDPDQVLEDGGTLTEEEKEILKNAGNDPFKASTSGAIFRPDTSGNYAKIDTLIQGETYTIYKYIGQNVARYDVRFTYVGTGNGDYSRDRLGVYRWVGLKKGSYLPIRLIPLPVKHDLAALQMSWQAGKSITVKGEVAASRLDQNIYSAMGNENNQGQAYTISARAQSLPLKIASHDLGILNLNLNTRYLDKNFRAVDRVFQPDFSRYWNVLKESQETNEEKSFQINGSYQPRPFMQLSGNFGQLQQGEFSSARRLAQIDFSHPAWFDYSGLYEFIGSAIEQDQIQNDWQRFRSIVKKNVWKLSPQILYNREHRKNNQAGRITGFQFNDIGLGLGLDNWHALSGNVRYSQRNDAIYDLQTPGQLIPQSVTDTRQLELSLQNVYNTTATFRLVNRSKKFESQFKQIKDDSLKNILVDPAFQDTVWQDRTTNLAELNLSHNAWKKALTLSIKYRISTEQTALREKVYIDVGENRGNYRYDEQLGEYVPDPDGNYILFIVQSGRFEPVTNFQSSFRFTVDPGRYWRRPSGGMQKLLSLISGETLLRVEEETKERNLWAIYLLNLSKFQGDSTLRGTIQLNQDLYIMRRNRNLSFRIRYKLNTSRYNQYLDANENEDRRTTELGLRTDWRVISTLRSQTELRRKDTFRKNAASPSRDRDIIGWYGNQNISWRPDSHWEFGLESQYGNEDNRAELYPLRLWFVQTRGRISYAFPGRGRITGEYNYQTVQTLENPLDLPVPYEMALGRKAGESKDWQLRGEYTVAKNILFTISYRGRDEAGFSRIIHSGQAEIRAFF